MTNPSSLSLNPSFYTWDQSEEETLKSIVFKIGDYFCALPIDAVLQVTETPSELQSHIKGLSLVMHENRTIMLLNLHQKLSYQLQSGESFTAEFLILTQTRQGELCGIPVDTLPNMMELPMDGIQPLPRVYRQTNIYNLARFVSFVQFEENQQKQAIYLLDVDEALQVLS